MVVLGCCAIVIGVLTFTDVRPAETSLIGALAAIAFALPVLRNALPGSPPLGVAADMWVFLWTELATVLSLALLVFKWASGPLRSRSTARSARAIEGRGRRRKTGRRRRADQTPKSSRYHVGLG